MVLRTRAPAKVNLTLHILGRRPDGFHDLESLVAFAGVADILEFYPGRPLGLQVLGPQAMSAGPTDDNLVLRAARALAERVPDLAAGMFRLVKRLPVGAGLGGGSADAGAALRLLARHNGLASGDERVAAAARATGSDVPVCVEPVSRVMRGTGDELAPPCGLRSLYAVLVNPGVYLETRTVFKALGLRPGEVAPNAEHPSVPVDGAPAAMLAAVAAGRNDMEVAARTLTASVGDVLDAIAAASGGAVIRMSGSGSSCFGLYETRGKARAAAAALSAARPEWWVRATALR